MRTLVAKIKEWLKIPNVRTEWFVFHGWNDEQKKKYAFDGNIDLLDEEIRSGRKGPKHWDGIWAIDTDASYLPKPGDRIKVLMDPEYATDESIIAYLAELGIIATKE